MWKCPICSVVHCPDNRDLSLSWNGSPLNIYRCACGLRYSNYAIEDKPADVYDDSYYDHVRYVDKVARDAYVLHLVGFFRDAVGLAKLPKTSRLLDIGCATGDFVAWALSDGWMAEGIDISPDAVALGVGKGLPLRAGGFEAMADEAACYDVVTAWDIIEHLPNMTDLLGIASKILKPNGVLVMKTVSSSSIIECIARAMYYLSLGRLQSPLKRIYVPGHLYYFTHDLLTRYLVQNGWEVILQSQSDTPSSALSESRLLQFALDTVSLVQKRTDRCYELLIACRKKPLQEDKSLL